MVRAWQADSSRRPSRSPDSSARLSGRHDYTIQPRSYEPVSFQQLQVLTDNYDLLCIAIETRKLQIARLPGQIRVRRPAGIKAGSLAAEPHKGRAVSMGEDGWKTKGERETKG